VIEVMVGDQDQLEVLDADARAAEPRLERREGTVPVGAGVDQRQRLAPEQPGIDRADVRQWDRYLNDVVDGSFPSSRAGATGESTSVWQTFARMARGG
jgi:hypothetical protein